MTPATDFPVFDRPSITTTRTLLYDTMSSFSVFDPYPDDEYSNNGLPQQGVVVHDNPTTTEFQFSSLTVTGTGTLRVIGVNPVRFRVSGLVTINGVVDLSGQTPATGDSAGGFKGGDSRVGLITCQPAGTCASFDQYINAGGCQNAANGFPFSEKGDGPGRGMEGGEAYTIDSVNNMIGSRAVGTGGGGSGGGGGAGGSISLVSGAEIEVQGGTITAAGGARAHVGTTLSCSTCNAGGDGGKGFIFLMDSDGEIEGLPNGTVGDHDVTEGILIVRAFSLSRFGAINATTRPFSAKVANPAYRRLSPADVSAAVDSGQTITLFVSSARADRDDPTAADIGTEGEPFPVAEITRDGALVKIDTSVGDMRDLNSGGIPARDEYVRVRAHFDYANPVQAALGSFASIDRVILTYRFNQNPNGPGAPLQAGAPGAAPAQPTFIFLRDAESCNFATPQPERDRSQSDRWRPHLRMP